MISRLKSLELQGYKTFANRTVFEFPGAVTAIVGPNGSGKSNITDALRWVLGEQSYSLLRGKKTEDMIFSGSERRTRSGMASATVILDNSDNWLPIDFTEVAIARRAYRDGSNEYLLNGQRVRLRDVSELLAESGLAERTYTIIGQGLVDAALALRAEDRRRLFEEAAGIGLHRARRQEAVRRLADTQRNLERVEDILLELRPRLRSLERQAHRAQEYDQAVDELQALLREWYGYHWHKAQEELSQAQTQANQRSAALEEIRLKESKLDDQINVLSTKRQDIRDKLNNYRSQFVEFNSKREINSRELAVAEERVKNLQEQEDKAHSELIKSEEEVSLLEERRRFAQEEIDRLITELEEAHEQRESIKSTFESRQHEREKIEVRLEDERKLLIKISTQRSELNSRNAERQIQVETLSNSLNSYQKSIVDGKARWRLVENDIEKSTKQIETTEGVLQEIEDSKTRIEEDILEYSKKHQDISRILAELETELSKNNARYEVINQAEQSLTGYSSGVRILLEAVKEAQLKDSKGILGTSLKVPEEFEIAIGAVLEEYIDAFILSSNKEVELALKILEQRSEKAAILPLDDLLFNGSSIDYAEEANVFGLASELVSAPKELEPAVKLLLGNALIVKDRKMARKVIRKIRRDLQNRKQLYEAKVVTLVGEVFYVQGLVRTSSNSKPVSLSRQREKKGLQQKLDQNHELLDARKEDAAQLELAISKIREEAARTEQIYQAQRQVRENAFIAHRKLLLEAEQLKRDIGWQEQQVSQIDNEIDRTKDLMHAATEIVDELEKRESEIEHQINLHVEQLQNLPMDDLRADLSYWTTRIAVLEQALNESKQRQTENENAIANAIHEARLIEAGINKLQDDQAQARELIESLKTTNLEITSQIELNSKSSIPLENDLEVIEQELTKLLSMESKERQLSNKAEHDYTQARIAQVRKQEALDALRRQIEADFGLVAFEYLEDISGPTPLPLDDFVEQLPVLTELSKETEQALNRQRSLLRRLGPVNPEAQLEYREVEKRYKFLTSQMKDLQEAAIDVQRVIEELDEIMEREFCTTFDAVAEEFHQIFGRLFGGGSARLVLTDPNDLTDTGIDIEARLPGRREQGLSLLSGGERSLTAVALVFALLRVSPTPFCVLDEVDAMLDEANVGRFRELLRELSQSTQFILITHNRATVQVADIIYGVTMGRDSTSQILSLKVDELEKVV